MSPKMFNKSSVDIVLIDDWKVGQFPPEWLRKSKKFWVVINKLGNFHTVLNNHQLLTLGKGKDVSHAPGYCQSGSYYPDDMHVILATNQQLMLLVLMLDVFKQLGERKKKKTTPLWK